MWMRGLRFAEREREREAELHLGGGAKKVIISAPPKVRRLVQHFGLEKNKTSYRPKPRKGISRTGIREMLVFVLLGKRTYATNSGMIKPRVFCRMTSRCMLWASTTLTTRARTPWFHDIGEGLVDN